MLAVGTQNGIHVFDLGDDRWSQRATALDGRAVMALAASPGAGVVAAVRDGGVWRSHDGERWTQLLDGVDARSVAVGGDGAIYAGAHPAAIHRSVDGGETWTELESIRHLPTYPSWNFPNPPNAGLVRSLACSARDARTVYAGIEVGGVLVSHDRGESWEESREGLHADVHALATAPGADGDVLYAATGKGCFRSRNGGAWWESACEGLLGLYAVAVAAHPAQPDVAYTASSQGRPRYWRDRPTGAAATIYRSRDAGASWAASHPVLSAGEGGAEPDVLTGAVESLAVDPRDPRVVFAGALNGVVYASGTAGESWEVVADGLPPVTAVVVF